ncbi:MAG: P-loop NTPase fold protein [Rhizobiaceae bacterium]|nr:P-loop NTPase fold protein [Rhizobiaceae bacterium]
MATKESSVETYTIKDLRAFKLSKALTSVLSHSFLSDGGNGLFEITPLTFLSTTHFEEGLSDTAATAFGDLFELVGFDPVSEEDKLRINSSDTPVSVGLYQAFERASQLRKMTSGKDEYIGLRHVLFSFFTSTDEPLFEDVNRILNDTLVDRQQAIKAIAAYCLEYAEKEENQDAWDKILADLELKRDELEIIKAAIRRADEIAVLQADDPWSEDAIDRSGAGNEAEAFAAMICARDFHPPLAVGVFGDWGSGKSFFMKLVHQAITRRTKRAGDIEQIGGSEDANDNEISFLKHIVQIRFNAWHYAETNLWASLVDHIFTSLDGWAKAHNSIPETEKVFRKLTSAKKQTVEAVRTLVDKRLEKQDAEKRLKTAEQELAEKRSALEKEPATFAKSAWEQVFHDADQKTAMKNAAQTLGLGDLSDSTEDLASAVKGLDGELVRFETLRSGVVRSLTLPMAIIAITGGIIVLPPLFAFLADRINDGLSPIAAAISGVFAPVALALSWAAGHTRKAMSVVKGFRSRFEQQIEQQSAVQKEREELAQKELARAEVAAEEAREQLSKATAKAMAASRAYHDQTDDGRVLRFVRDRVMGGEYSKQLSFAAIVRKDFEELSALMTRDGETQDAAEERQLLAKHIEQLILKSGDLLEDAEKDTLQEISAVPSQPKAVFQRIVLYIDDLDRCPPEQVINVLQAIHLLLSFPLFVVFVAVDVRWLRKSLTTEYAGLLGGGNGADGTATASDYLEKIFQLPYWVRAMEPDGTRQILRDRMGPEKATSRNPADPSFAVDMEHPPEPTGKGPGVPALESIVDPGTSVPTSPDQQSAVSLDLTTEERAFIEEIAETLDGSPRRTLRFINSYRIIKASLDDDALTLLEEQGFAALATLLAISVSADEAYPLIVSALTSGKANDTAALKLVFDEADGVSAPVSKRIHEALDRLDGHGVDWAQMTQYSAMVARFAFHRANGATEPTDAPLA